MDTGTFRLVYLPFDLGPLEADVTHALLESGLTYLNGTGASELIFEREQTIGKSLLLLNDAGDPAVGVRVPEGAVRAQLEVRRLPEMELVRTVPLSRQTDSTFGADIPVDESGSYLFSARIFDREGKSLPNSARRQVLRLMDRPHLVFVNESSGEVSRSRSRARILEAMAMQGTQADIIDYPEKDKAIYEELILTYASEDRTLFWLGDFGEPYVSEMLTRFLDSGGRLFLGAKGSPISNTRSVSAFLENSFSTSSLGFGEERLVSVLPGTFGANLDGTASHRSRYRKLHPVSPAIPVLLSANGFPAGIYVDTGSYKAMHLAFDVVNYTRLSELLGSALSWLHQSPRQPIQMQFPQAQQSDGRALVLAGSEAPIRVTTSANVDSVELLVRSAAVIASPVLPMKRNLSAEVDGQRTFHTSWRFPVRGNYIIVARLRDTEGRRLIGSELLNVEAALDDSIWNPVLVVGKQRTNGDSITADALAVMEQERLAFNLLDNRTELSDKTLYDLLLRNYLGEGKFVVWLSWRILEAEQQAITTFTREGGRILLATPNFRSPEFQERVLGVDPQMTRNVLGEFDTVSGKREDGKIVFAPVQPLQGTEPVLVDKEGRVAAVRRDGGFFRTAFIGVGLDKIDSKSRRQLLQQQINFLLDVQEIVEQPRLEIASVQVADLEITHEGVTVGLVVANRGNGQSPPYRVEYQLLREGQVIAAGQQQLPVLEAFHETEITFPALDSLKSGSYQVRVGLADSLAGPATFLDPRPLELVDVPVTYVPVEIQGQLGNSNGAGFFDFDGDEDLDFLLVRQGYEDQLFRNDGEGFTEIGQAAGVADGGAGRGFAVGDHDGDGDLDLYLVRQSQSNLFLRNDRGRFSEVTSEHTSPIGALLGDEGSGRSAGFWDADSDGDLDLYLVNAFPDTNRLFRNDGAVFVDYASAVGLADAGDGRGLSFGDYDRDGDADLLVANKSGPSRLFRNGVGGFEEVGESLGIPFSNDDVAGVFDDYDGDGFLDLYTTGETSTNRLFKNLEGTGFRWMNEEGTPNLGAGCAGATFVDADNDGDLDLITTGVSGGGDQLYENKPGHWIAMGPLAGLAGHSAGRGLSSADFDGDGDQDLLVADSNESRLYRSELETSQWLQVDLAGIGRNRDALGALIQLVTAGGNQYKELHPGFGYGSQAHSEIHFGLGQESHVDICAGLPAIRLEILPRTGIYDFRPRRAECDRGELGWLAQHHSPALAAICAFHQCSAQACEQGLGVCGINADGKDRGVDRIAIGRLPRLATVHCSEDTCGTSKTGIQDIAVGGISLENVHGRPW